MPKITIKKYSNRRLYDTDESRYVTLDELAAKVRSGTDVRVLDAKSGADLTQPTLTQIIIESRGAGRLLPVPLLTQLIRMGDDALAEFFGQYVTGALELYLGARTAARKAAEFYPAFGLPLGNANPFMRMMSNMWLQRGRHEEERPMSLEPDAFEPAEDLPERSTAADIADLRRELEALKDVLKSTVSNAPISDSSKAKATRSRATKKG